MRLEHHLVGGYVRYISPHIIIIIIENMSWAKRVVRLMAIKLTFSAGHIFVPRNLPNKLTLRLRPLDQQICLYFESTIISFH